MDLPDAAWIAIGVTLIAVIFVTALVLDDPSVVQRGGSLLTAYSAAMIVVAALLEFRNDDTGSSTQVSRSGIGGPLKALEKRIQDAAKTKAAFNFRRSRLRVIIIHSITAVVGELLQGFGDIPLVLFAR